MKWAAIRVGIFAGWMAFAYLVSRITGIDMVLLTAGALLVLGLSLMVNPKLRGAGAVVLVCGAAVLVAVFHR